MPEVASAKQANRVLYFVGVDPGVNTGIGILQRDGGKVLHWCTRDFHSAQTFLENTFPVKSQATVFVEVPNGFMYNRNDAAENKVRDNMMLKIGGVRREAQLLAAALTRRGFNVVEVLPVRGKKWDQYRFELFAKCKRRASEHERDAVRLAHYYGNKR